MANTNKKRTHKDKAAAQFARTERNKQRQAKARARKAQSRLGKAASKRILKRIKQAQEDGDGHRAYRLGRSLTAALGS